jgi:DNA-binding NarL/FixJ family response regulator
MGDMRIALADDQRLFVESLSRTITARASDIEVVGIAYDGYGIIDLVASRLPQLVLMDVRMPRLDGVEACRIVLNRFPETKVMMLTTFDDDEYVVAALRYGAVGYLLKNVSPEEVITSIRAVREGAVQMSPEIARRHFNEVYDMMEKGGGSRRFPDWYNELTGKERQIIFLVSRGKTNKEIGTQVNLADQTVRNYISSIYQRLNIKNRAELIRLVLEAGLPGPGG